MKERPWKKDLWAVKFLFLSLFLVAVQANAQKGQLSVFGGWSRVFASGSEVDYVPGENDFPITPAHSPLQLGVALGICFVDQISVELDYRYFLSSRVTLMDPSDLDSVEVDSSRHHALTVNAAYRVFKNRLSPYVLVGGGFDNLLAKDEMHRSEFGFDIEFLAPEKRTNGVVNLGGGIIFSTLRSLMTRLDVRYSLIFSDPHQKILSLSLGLTYAF